MFCFYKIVKDCVMMFIYVEFFSGKFNLIVFRELECGNIFNVMIIFLVVVGSIFLVGFVFLVIWKLFVIIYDWREFVKF